MMAAPPQHMSDYNIILIITQRMMAALPQHMSSYNILVILTQKLTAAVPKTVDGLWPYHTSSEFSVVSI